MADIIKLTIDGVAVSGEKGDSILKIATANGIEIPTLCHNEKVRVYGACGLCVVEADGIPKLLRSCATAAADGMVIHTDTPRVLRSRKIALELMMSDHDGDCRGPCVLNCPAGTDCQQYVKQIAEGDFHGAVKTIKEKLPLPASIGRVCPHPCEKACRRKMVEEPVSIAALKYFAADRDLEADTYVPQVAAPSGKKVSVIGGGPGGLTAAYYLRLSGHDVTVYDAMPRMGGMLRYGIPEYRLPKVTLDREVEEIASLGVVMKNGVKIGKDITLDEIRAASDAMVIAVGAWKSSAMRCPGEELDGVVGGIDFLRAASIYSTDGGEKPDIGKRVAVVGGGNTAMDACRTAVRLGAEEVSVIYRRTRDEMPAEDVEIREAEEEGVVFRYLCAPSEIIGQNGKVCGMKLQKMRLGEPDASGRRKPEPIEGEFETIELDTVVAAIGQVVNVKGFEQLELNEKRIIAADEATFRTSLEGVFAVGDATNRGASIAIAAIGEAGKAAAVVNSFLNGSEIPYRAPYFSEREVTPDMLADREKVARRPMPTLSPEERRGNFREVALGYDRENAIAEAKRCLSCGCHDYSECKLIKYARMLPVEPARFAGAKNTAPIETRLVSIERNPSKCILCGLCVRVCDEVAHKGILGLVGRGFEVVVKPEFNDPAVISKCADCLECANACPTGALRIL